MRDIFKKELLKVASKNKKIFLLTADLGYGVFDEFEKKYPNQYLNVGVAEQNLIGVATGLAHEGKIVIAYSIANFLTLRCFEQIRNDALYHNLNIKLVSTGGGYTYGALGMSHHATEDLSVLNTLPNIKIIAPSTATDTKELFYKLIASKGVAYFRLEKSALDVKPLVTHNYKLGTFQQYTTGNDMAIIAIGGIFAECMKACVILKKKNINISLFSISSLKPIDNKLFIKTFKNYKYILTVEENNFIGGLGSTISFLILKNKLKCYFFSSSTNDETFKKVGTQSYLRKLAKLDCKSLINFIKKIMK